MQQKNDHSLFWILTLLLAVILLLVLVVAAGFLRVSLSDAITPQSTTYNLQPSSSTPTAAPTSTPTLPPRPALRDLAEPYDMQVGVAVGYYWLEDPQYSTLLKREFNAIVPENAMKFEVIHPERDQYDFKEGDAIFSFARQNGLSLRGHTLVWGNQLPKWMLEGDFTREEWIDIMREHITTVVGHYRDLNQADPARPKGTLIAWDVVNEAVGKQGELFDNFWLQKIGPEYIPLAFQFAHEADPSALLFYNDNGGEGLNPKSQGIYNLVQGLVNSGVPIHGVGLQLHTDPNVMPSPLELAANIKRLNDLGLEVQITEMDVRLQNIKGTPDEKLKAQAEIYRQALTVCLQAAKCKGFFTWGLTDRFSWIPGITGKPDSPLLFSEDYRPKPALDAIIEVFQGK
jgi:endo-1,4-beta-xylanase